MPHDSIMETLRNARLLLFALGSPTDDVVQAMLAQIDHHLAGPSDAAVEAALTVWYDNDPNWMVPSTGISISAEQNVAFVAECRDEMRAALTAALNTKEQG